MEVIRYQGHEEILLRTILERAQVLLKNKAKVTLKDLCHNGICPVILEWGSALYKTEGIGCNGPSISRPDSISLASVIGLALSSRGNSCDF